MKNEIKIEEKVVNLEMPERKPIAKYETTVYSDGAITHVLLETYVGLKDDIEVEETSVSARMRYIMLSIREWIRLKHTDTGLVLSNENITSQAMNVVSKNEEVTYSTISDKAGRRGFGSVGAFTEAVSNFDAVRGDDGGVFESKLKALASVRSIAMDRAFITQQIQEIKDEFYK